jgi:hypothetical protein
MGRGTETQTINNKQYQPESIVMNKRLSHTFKESSKLLVRKVIFKNVCTNYVKILSRR